MNREAVEASESPGAPSLVVTRSQQAGDRQESFRGSGVERNSEGRILVVSTGRAEERGTKRLLRPGDTPFAFESCSARQAKRDADRGPGARGDRGEHPKAAESDLRAACDGRDGQARARLDPDARVKRHPLAATVLVVMSADGSIQGGLPSRSLSALSAPSAEALEPNRTFALMA